MTSRQESATININSSSSIETIQSLKSMSNISTINFVQKIENFGEDDTKVVDNLVDLLNTNHNIKSLNSKASLTSTVSLFEALAAGKAGYSLESLREDNWYLGTVEAWSLGSYLTTTPNLKRLEVSINESSSAMQVVSSLACSTVVELALHVHKIDGGCLRRLGTKLRQCNSIDSLQISFCYHRDQYDPADNIKFFFKEGPANMRCLKHLHMHHKVQCSSTQISAYEDGLLETIKSSRSITTAALRHVSVPSPSFHDEVESRCIINRVFGTNLIGFEPTDLWTRVLAKICNDSARETFLFRLLRDKPELLIVGNVQPICKSFKRQVNLCESTHDVGKSLERI